MGIMLDAEDLDSRSNRMAFINSPIEKHILLLKLTNLMGNRPSFEEDTLDPDSPQRQWVAIVKATAHRVDDTYALFELARIEAALDIDWHRAINKFQGQISTIIEGLKIDLEISGEAEIGSAYEPGEVYKFFADLKSIIAGASQSIFIIDAYFNGSAFDDYLSEVSTDLSIRILTKRYVKEVEAYARRHVAERSSAIELRSSNEIHDRVIFIDDGDCWVMGGSVKDAAEKPAYLIPLHPKVASDKLRIYEDVWIRACPHDLEASS